MSSNNMRPIARYCATRHPRSRERSRPCSTRYRGRRTRTSSSGDTSAFAALRADVRAVGEEVDEGDSVPSERGARETRGQAGLAHVRGLKRIDDGAREFRPRSWRPTARRVSRLAVASSARRVGTPILDEHALGSARSVDRQPEGLHGGPEMLRAPRREACSSSLLEDHPF